MRGFILLAVAFLALTAVAAEEKKIVCYFGSWAAYRRGDGRFVVEDIDPTLCTHLIYTFVGLAGDNVRVLDPWQDLPKDSGKNGFARFTNLRSRNPAAKMLIAIGGWNEGSVKYSRMAANPKSRARFVKNVVAFVKKYDFDGFDLDWEYPAQRQGAPHDVQNFVELLKELRAAFDVEGLILSGAVASAEFSASLSYNIPEISKYFHFINVMTYDLHGAWDKKTGINAPLYPAADETGKDRQLNVDAAINYWLSQGAPAEKLILGMATYGRSFTLANPKNNGVGAASRGPGAAGPFTREPSNLGYNEICTFVQSKGWTVTFDEERRVPYATKGNQWVGYDNIQSIAEKSEYVKKMNLGGAMIWSVETDDFKGKCGEKYPLLKTINSVLRGGKIITEAPTSTQATTTQVPTKAPTKASTKEQSTTSTTSEAPRDSTSNSNNAGNINTDLCKSAGIIPDPNSCGFIQCLSSFGSKFIKYHIACPKELCYNPSFGGCDWKKK